MEYVLYILLGIGLAAACGFRVFLPLLVMSIAALAGALRLSAEFSWIGTWPALIVFAVATGTEIAAYYLPWLDHLLDFISTPAAIAAGVIVTASVVTDMSPLVRWPLAAIAGGGVAAIIQLGTVALRRTVTYASAGFAHPLAASVENLGALLLSATSLLLPLLAGILTILLLTLLVLFAIRRRSGKQRTECGRQLAP